MLERALAAQIAHSAEEHALAIRLQESDKLAALGALSATLAHEVNNPLASILAMAELMRATPLNDTQRADVDGIIAEARRTTNVVREMLRAARPASGVYESLALSAVVTNVLGVVRPLARKHHIAIDVAIPDDLPAVRGQSGRLEQVMLNLLVNALQACEEQRDEGVVRVRASASEGEVILRVEDNGHGFAPGVPNRIFDRFFTTKPVGKGTGLGLWIAKQIIEEHRGTLEASNRAEGGACLELRLPVHASAVDEPEVREQSPTMRHASCIGPGVPRN
jgi:signal transduction histidine kinase